MTEPRKLYVRTYGCQMNVYDSERMAEALAPAGYVATDSPDDADMILLNTCHIREKAAEKVYSELGRFKPLKAARPDLKIGVAGCVAQAEGEEAALSHGPAAAACARVCGIFLRPKTTISARFAGCLRLRKSSGLNQPCCSNPSCPARAIRTMPPIIWMMPFWTKSSQL